MPLGGDGTPRLRCYPGVSSPGLVWPAGVEPASAGFLCPRAQTVRPMCPSVRAVKRLSALPHIGRRVSPPQGGTDNRRVDQTHRGGAGGCRTRTFAALAQPRAFRRRSFLDELPAPYSAHPASRRGLRPVGSPFGGCPRPRCFAPSLSHARSNGMTSTFPQSTDSGRRRVSSHAVSCGSSSSGVFRLTTA